MLPWAGEILHAHSTAQAARQGPLSLSPGDREQKRRLLIHRLTRKLQAIRNLTALQAIIFSLFLPLFPFLCPYSEWTIIFSIPSGISTACWWLW